MPNCEHLALAPYAMHDADSQGRAHPEPAHPYRSVYQRDRDRIVHCSAFRRLSHKTQVFTGELGDYHRTRLTHTMEVASIARTIARALRLNEDLVEALALGHDIGHPPFGHAGEDVLDEVLAGQGGFNHNAQAVRIFEMLEQRYVAFPGLNLSHEVLAGQRRRAKKSCDLHERPLLEVQVVDAADSIAYDAHDADDALELGVLTEGQLSSEVPMWAEASQRVRARYTALTPEQLRRATVHELLDCQVNDLLNVAQQRLEQLDLQSAEQVRQAPLLAAHSSELAEQKSQLELFLFNRVYRHPTVLSHREDAANALRALFEHYRAEPENLPKAYFCRLAEDSLDRTIADYLSSITDRYALEAYDRLPVQA